MHRKLDKSRSRRCAQNGEAFVEFTLIGIPLIMICISCVEMARGMWLYHTLQYATKTANAYAATHGATCGSPNSCTVHVSDVVGVFENYAIGLPMSATSITLTSSTAANSVTCAQVSTCSSGTSWNTQWPPSSNGDNAVGKPIAIQTEFKFTTALAMVWPSAGKVLFHSSAGNGAFYFPGYGYQLIEF